ncbi:hypothetical protein K1719_007916 [Acacia pycnantha]|nr:hypothetical protein K1719_007916 [Acacia pycnantha]
MIHVLPPDPCLLFFTVAFQICSFFAVVFQIWSFRMEKLSLLSGYNFSSLAWERVFYNLFCSAKSLLEFMNQGSKLYRIQVFDPFSILGLEPGALESEIKKKYRRLSVQYHLDKNPDPEATKYFVENEKSPFQTYKRPEDMDFNNSTIKNRSKRFCSMEIDSEQHSTDLNDSSTTRTKLFDASLVMRHLDFQFDTSLAGVTPSSSKSTITEQHMPNHQKLHTYTIDPQQNYQHIDFGYDQYLGSDNEENQDGTLPFEVHLNHQQANAHSLLST